MSLLRDRSCPLQPTRLERYPQPNESVRAVIHQAKRDKVGTGRFTGKVARMRTGCVMGFVIADGTAKPVGVPWTTDRKIVEFYSDPD